MQVQFFYNKSDERQIYKELIPGETLNGTLREESSLINPIILFQSDSVMKYNFMYIPEWNRYYFIRGKESYRNHLYYITAEVDVLMSFKNDIANCQVVIDKQTMPENGDEYIDDGSLVSDNYMFNRVYNFSNGFNENPTYILICAG